MKILILSNNFFPDIGGIESNSEILGASFTKLGHEVHLLTWTSYDGNVDFPFKIVRNPPFIQLFRSHLWADVILENNPCLRLAWPNLFVKKPSVVVLNTWVSRVNGAIAFQDKLKLRWLKRAGHVIAVSKAIQDTCFKDAIVVGNPYRQGSFYKKENIKASKDFVFLGRLVSDKGASLAIKAIHDFNERSAADLSFVPYELTIIGEGQERSYLEQLTIKLKMQNSVKFTGSLTGEALNNQLNEHKYLLVPSMWKEPFGNVALEGIACGCIPIVSDGGGLPDAVGAAGLTFKSGNLASMVSVIRSLTARPQLQKQLRSNAAAHLKDHHPEVISKKYLAIMADAYQIRHSQEGKQSLHWL
jgi:glycosyltransferase involved in cell wall biosynthesis